MKQRFISAALLILCFAVLPAQAAASQFENSSGILGSITGATRSVLQGTKTVASHTLEATGGFAAAGASQVSGAFTSGVQSAWGSLVGFFSNLFGQDDVAGPTQTVTPAPEKPIAPVSSGTKTSAASTAPAPRPQSTVTNNVVYVTGSTPALTSSYSKAELDAKFLTLQNDINHRFDIAMGSIDNHTDSIGNSTYVSNSSSFDASSITSLTLTSLAVSGGGTTTFANGIDVATGCFAINGTCISGGIGGGLSFGKSWEINSAGYLAPTTTITALLNNGFVSQASSTVVGNFNVSSSLGIGTTTPWGLLSVNANALSAGTPQFVIGSSTGTNFVVSNNGNIGIGTTSPYANLAISSALNGNMATALNVLAVHGGVTAANDGQGILLSAGNTPTISGTNGGKVTINGGNGGGVFTGGIGGNVEITAGSAIGIGGTGGNVVINPGFASTLIGTPNIGNVLLATSFGNVGIGTTSPYAKLSVVGTVVASNFVGTTTATSTFGGGLDITSGCFSINGTCISGGGGGSGIVGSGTTGQFPYYAASGTTLSATSSLFLATSGFVGIGTTTPFAALSVHAAAGATSFIIGSSTATNFIVNKNGYVGIGTSNPVNKLHIGTVNAGDGITFQSATDDALMGTISQQNTVGTTRGLAIDGASGRPLSIGGIVNTNILLGVAGGNVGIGTTSPWAQLSVNSNALGSGVPEFVIGSSSATHFVVTGNGNVGVGISAPEATLQINGSANALSNLDTPANYALLIKKTVNSNGAAMGIGFGDSSSVGANSIGASIYHIRQGSNSYGDLVFATKPSGGNVTERMRIDSSGNVGIGSTTPIEELSLSGTFAVKAKTSSDNTWFTAYNSAGTNVAIMKENSGSGLGGLAFSGWRNGGNGTAVSFIGNVQNDNGSEMGLLFNTAKASDAVSSSGSNVTNTPIAAFCNNFQGGLLSATSTCKMIITAGGNLGIGTTTPWATLAVNPAAGEASNQFVVGSSTATNFIVTNEGLVGIGTAVPSRTLTVAGGDIDITTGGLRVNGVTRINNSGNVRATAGNAAGPGYAFNSDPASGLFLVSGGLGFATGGIERMRVDSSGNLGIGTSSPYAKLSVVGEVVAANFTGTTTATSTLAGGLQTNLLSVTSSTASSTFANGINLTAGCFSINGTCVGGSGGSSFGKSWEIDAAGYLAPTTSITALLNNGFVSQASSTIIGNFNVSGNVGVGTTNPTGTLSVSNSSGNLFVATSSGVLRTVLAGNGGQTWYLNDGTNEVGRITYTTPGGQPGIVFFNTSGTGRSQIKQLSSGGGLSFGAGTGSSDPGSQMVLNTSGNLGIGTTSPSAKLEVNGVFRLGANNSNWMSIGAYNNTTDNFGYISSAGQTNGTGLKFETANGSGSNTGTTQMTITNTGFVGIGTSSPLARLDITGNASSAQYQSALLLSETSGNTNSRNWAIGNGSSNYGDLSFHVSSAVGGPVQSLPAIVFTRAGNVGIGTATPAYQLQVQGLSSSYGTLDLKSSDTSTSIGDTLGQLSFTAGDGGLTGSQGTVASIRGIANASMSATASTHQGALAFFTQGSSDTGLLERLRISSAGNFQLGTTTAGTSVRFHIQDRNAAAAVSLLVDGDSDSDDVLLKLRSVANPDSVAAYADTDTKFIVTGAGNVGIGTTTPSAKLDISGSHTASIGLLRLNSAASNIAAMTFYPGGTYAGALYGDTTGDMLLGTNASTKLQFYTNSAANVRMVIDSSGNVGIGTTSPMSALSVSGSSGIVANLTSNTSGTRFYSGFYNNTEQFKVAFGGSGEVQFIVNDTVDNTNGSYFIQKNGESFARAVFGRSFLGFGPGSATRDVFLNRSAANTLSVSSDQGTGAANLTVTGNVGIGTSSPYLTLSVSTSTYETAIFKRTTASAGGVIAFENGNGQRWGFGAGSAGEFVIDDRSNNGTIPFKIQNGAPVNSFYISSTGNVGIGTSSPYAKLSVNNYSAGASTLPLFAISSSTGSGATSTAFIVDRFGNVGINTTDPKVKLHVSVDGSAPASSLYNSSFDSFLLSNSGGGANLRLLAAESQVGNGSALTFLKSRGTPASPTIVQSGDALGTIFAQGYDGANRQEATQIRFEVDGTPGTSDMPGRIAFLTTPDGSATALTRLTIKNDGNVGIGTTSPSEMLSVAASGGQSAYFEGNIGVGKNDPTARIDIVVPNGVAIQSLSGSASAYAFHVLGRASQDGLWGVAGGSGQFLTDSAAGDIIFRADTGKLLFGANGGNASNLAILQTGNVGIGTTSPYAKLSVVGEVVAANFTGTTTATSTLAGGLQTNLLRVTSTTASSTFSNGINLTAGCFSVGGSCIGGGSFSNTLASGGTGTTTFYSGGIVFSDGTKLTQSAAQSNFFWDETNKRLGIGTSSPYAKLSVVGEVVAANFTGTTTATSTLAGGLQTNLLRVTSTTASSTFSNGINLTAGCFSIGGTCIGGGGGVSGTINSGSANQLAYYSGSTALSGNTLLLATADGMDILKTTDPKLRIGEGTGAGANAYIGWVSSSNNFVIGSQYGPAFYMSDNGSIGINASPSGGYQFEVEGELFADTVSAGSINGGSQVSASLFVAIDPGQSTNSCVDAAFSGGIMTFCNSESDERLKTDITRVSGVLDKLTQLDAVTYHWNDVMMGLHRNAPTNLQIGFIAQNVQSVFPELVNTGTDGYLGVNYAKMSAVLVEAVKEMNFKVDSIIGSTTATSTLFTHQSFGEQFLAWISDKVVSVKELVVGTLRVRDQVCADEVCISKDQFKNLLLQAGSANAAGGGSGNSGAGDSGQTGDGSSGGTTSTTTDDGGDIETGTTTPPVITDGPDTSGTGTSTPDTLEENNGQSGGNQDASDAGALPSTQPENQPEE